jgi:hypothetical protein
MDGADEAEFSIKTGGGIVVVVVIVVVAAAVIAVVIDVGDWTPPMLSLWDKAILDSSVDPPSQPHAVVLMASTSDRVGDDDAVDRCVGIPTASGRS